MKIRTILTGATGMVGEGVLLECLNHPDVEQILVINRKPGGLSHPKLREIIHTDFFDLTPLQPQLIGFNACFFCLGVSSVGMSKEEYAHITHDLTLNVARLLAKLNPEMTFCYVTGAGTDSSEQVVQTDLYVAPRLYETYAGPEEYKKLLQACCLVLSHWQGALPRGLLYFAGSGAGHDQRCQQRLSETNSGSTGHR
jgi:putative NADH-flavin reductase